MQIHLWAELKSPILFGAGLSETKKPRIGRGGAKRLAQNKKAPNLAERGGCFEILFALIHFLPFGCD